MMRQLDFFYIARVYYCVLTINYANGMLK